MCVAVHTHAHTSMVHTYIGQGSWERSLETYLFLTFQTELPQSMSLTSQEIACEHVF